MPRFLLTIKDRTLGGVTLPPCQSFTIGKLDFRRYTQIPSQVEGVPDETYLGAVGEYSEADVTAFKGQVANYVVRWGVTKSKDKGPSLRSAQVYDTRINTYSPMPDRDEPLADYLGVQPIALGAHMAVASMITAEQAAQRQEAQAAEDKARATDPTDDRRRKQHGRAKAAGESLEA